MDLVVIVSGGPVASVPPAPVSGLDGAFVIAADSGADHAAALGLDVDHLVGDLDSISAEAERRLTDAGDTKVTRVPAEKDATDLELAVEVALDHRPDRLLVLGARGGRLDHELAGLLLLGSERLASMEVRARVGGVAVTVIREESSLDGRPGDLLSLLPVHGPARGVTTAGLQYPLRGEDLLAGSTRGVSNVFVDPTATVSLTDGVLLAIQPEPEPHPEEPS